MVCRGVDQRGGAESRRSRDEKRTTGATERGRAARPRLRSSSASAPHHRRRLSQPQAHYKQDIEQPDKRRVAGAVASFTFLLTALAMVGMMFFEFIYFNDTTSETLAPKEARPSHAICHAP